MPDEHDLEQAYQEALVGSGHPKFILMPEGAFFEHADGSITVSDFDADGNYFPLSEEEQSHRIQLAQKRLGL